MVLYKFRTVELGHTTCVTQHSAVVTGCLMRNEGHELTFNTYHGLRRRSIFPSSPQLQRISYDISTAFARHYPQFRISAAALIAEAVTTQQSAMPKGHTRFTMRVGDGVPKKPVVPHRCYRRERLDRDKSLKSRIRCNSHSEALHAVANVITTTASIPARSDMTNVRALSMSVVIVLTAALFWIFRDK